MPWRHYDRPDPPPRERPSPSEYLDPPAPFECEFCGATERDHPEDRCERCDELASVDWDAAAARMEERRP